MLGGRLGVITNQAARLNCGSGSGSFKVVAMSTTGERFERAVAIMKRLRAPGGCPWDREQTF